MRIGGQCGGKGIGGFLRHFAAAAQHQRFAIGGIQLRITLAGQGDDFRQRLGGVARIVGGHIGLTQIAPGARILGMLVHALNQEGNKAIDLASVDPAGFTLRQMRAAHHEINSAANGDHCDGDAAQQQPAALQVFHPQQRRHREGDGQRGDQDKTDDRKGAHVLWPLYLLRTRATIMPRMVRAC